MDGILWGRLLTKAADLCLPCSMHRGVIAPPYCTLAQYSSPALLESGGVTFTSEMTVILKCQQVFFYNEKVKMCTQGFQHGRGFTCPGDPGFLVWWNRFVPKSSEDAAHFLSLKPVGDRDNGGHSYLHSPTLSSILLFASFWLWC